MIFFHNINELQELKARYHKLAWKYHPDRGGHAGLMKRLNQEYQRKKQELLHRKLSEIKEGDTVYVNGSECKVISITNNTFIARSVITQRQALFDKYTGNCLTYKNFNATIREQHEHKRK